MLTLLVSNSANTSHADSTVLQYFELLMDLMHTAYLPKQMSTLTCDYSDFPDLYMCSWSLAWKEAAKPPHFLDMLYFNWF